MSADPPTADPPLPSMVLTLTPKSPLTYWNEISGELLGELSSHERQESVRSALLIHLVE